MSKRSLLILLLIIGGVIVAGVTLTLRRNPTVEMGREPAFSPAAAPAQSPTADWKVYRNEQLGFEFHYPPMWTVVEYSQTNFEFPVVTLISPETKALIEKPYPRGLPRDSGNLSIYVYESVGELGSDSLISYLNNPPAIYGAEQINLNGYPAYEAWIGGYGLHYALFLEVNDKIFEIILERTFKKENITDIERRILSSFRIMM